MTLPLRLVRLLSILSAFAVCSLVGATAASARTYPKKIRTAFVNSCAKTAVETADGALTKKEAKKACKQALVCIEGKLSYQEFQQAKANDPAVKQCIKQVTSGN